MSWWHMVLLEKNHLNIWATLFQHRTSYRSWRVFNRHPAAPGTWSSWTCWAAKCQAHRPCPFGSTCRQSSCGIEGLKLGDLREQHQPLQPQPHLCNCLYASLVWTSDCGRFCNPGLHTYIVSIHMFLHQVLFSASPSWHLCHCVSFSLFSFPWGLTPSHLQIPSLPDFFSLLPSSVSVVSILILLLRACSSGMPSFWAMPWVLVFGLFGPEPSAYAKWFGHPAWPSMAPSGDKPVFTWFKNKKVEAICPTCTLGFSAGTVTWDSAAAKSSSGCVSTSYGKRVEVPVRGNFDCKAVLYIIVYST